MREPILTGPEHAFVAETRRATLATGRPDGEPRLVPVCFVLTDEPDDMGRPVLYSPIDEKPKASADPRRLAPDHIPPLDRRERVVLGEEVVALVDVAGDLDRPGPLGEGLAAGHDLVEEAVDEGAAVDVSAGIEGDEPCPPPA